MPNRQNSRRGNEGFTLIEIMIALAILGMSLFVLLDMHYNAVHVQSRLEQEIRVRNLLSLATGISEVEVAAGNLQGSEEFGDRYPGWRYSFDAEEFDSSSSSSSSSSGSTASPAFPGLYYVVVKVQDPDKVEYNLEYYTVVRTQVTAQGNPDDEGDDGGTGGSGTGGGGTGSGGASGGGGTG